MFDFVHQAWLVIVSWFHPDMAHGVMWGSLLVTFVASVMGKDQRQRLEQGKFGLAAGTSLGALSGLLEKQPNLVVVGFVGSAIGGLLGWLFYLILAFSVMSRPKLKNLIVFQTGGLEGFQKQLDLQSKENLRAGFDAWTEKFSRLMSDSKSDLVSRVGVGKWEEEAINVIRGWLTTAVDTLALVFGTLADKPQYESRVTIIVYRVSETDPAQVRGQHWISYAGQLKPHLKEQQFDQSSVGYRVLKRQLESPYFTTKALAQQGGQKRADDQSYRPFITFFLNESAIMALDWPEELKEDDDYVRAARSLFNSDVTPVITEILRVWPRALADGAGLPAFQANVAPTTVPVPALVSATAPVPSASPSSVPPVPALPASVQIVADPKTAGPRPPQA